MRLVEVFQRCKRRLPLLSASQKWLKLQLTNPLRRQRRPLRTSRLLLITKSRQLLKASLRRICRLQKPPRSKSLHWGFATPDLVRKFSQRLVLQQATTRPLWSSLEAFALTSLKSSKVRVYNLNTPFLLEINESDIKRA